MPVTYRSPKPDQRERILLWGDTKAGKSQACVDVVTALKDVKHHVIEADYNPTWDLLMEGDVAERVVREQVYAGEWTPYVETVRKWSKGATKNDWLYVDSMTPSWPAVHAYYTEAIVGKTVAQLFMEHARKVRQGGKKGNPLEGDTDWTAINALYNEFYVALSRWPGHVMLTCQWKKVGDRDSEADKRAYSGRAKGYRPDGQKNLERWPATSLIVTKGKGHTLTTFGDRGRVELDGASWSHDDEEVGEQGFFKVYLRGVAGWKMMKVEG